MHELGITESALNAALSAAQQAGATKISAVNFAMRLPTDFTQESVVFYFGMLSKGTPAEGAELSFTERQATLNCHNCGGATEPTDLLLAKVCPLCGSTSVEMDPASSLYPESIEVDTQPVPA